MCLSDMEVDRGFDHQDHMGTEAWRIGVVTRIETGPINRPGGNSPNAISNDPEPWRAPFPGLRRYPTYHEGLSYQPRPEYDVPINRPDYGPTGSGAPVLAALLGVVGLIGILAGITAGILAVAS